MERALLYRIDSMAEDGLAEIALRVLSAYVNSRGLDHSDVSKLRRAMLGRPEAQWPVDDLANAVIWAELQKRVPRRHRTELPKFYFWTEN